MVRARVVVLTLLTVGILWGGISYPQQDNFSWGKVASLVRFDQSATRSVATTSKIIVTGDVFLGRDVERVSNRFGEQYPLHLFQSASFFTNTDAVVVNFEASVPDTHVPTPDFGMEFSVASSTLSALVSAGVTHAGLANNHTMDFGRSAYVNTWEQMSTRNLAPFGDPTTLGSSSVAAITTVQGPLYFVSILGLQRSYTETELRTLLQNLPSERAGVVAYVHWGTEYASQPNQNQKQLAQKLVDAGFDLVLGHHPHVVQSITKIDGVPILYSLGNTIFDQYFSSDVQQGLIVSLRMSRKKRWLQLHPVSSIGSRARPYHMPARERANFLEAVAQQSNQSLYSSIQRGIIPWP
jgi:poly-gamma-glutamate synthesis protein (capsule biosynthesis protein)